MGSNEARGLGVKQLKAIGADPWSPPSKVMRNPSFARSGAVFSSEALNRLIAMHWLAAPAFDTSMLVRRFS